MTCKDAVGSYATRVSAILYKTSKLKLRKYISSAFEFLLPVAVVGLMLLLRFAIGPAETVDVQGLVPEIERDPTVYTDADTQSTLFGYADLLNRTNRVIAIGPENKFTKDLVAAWTSINPIHYDGRFIYFDDLDALENHFGGANGPYPSKSNKQIEFSVIFQSFAPEYQYTFGHNAFENGEDDDPIFYGLSYLFEDSDQIKSSNDGFEYVLQGAVRNATVFTENSQSVFMYGGQRVVQRFIDTMILRKETNSATASLPFVHYDWFPNAESKEDVMVIIMAIGFGLILSLASLWPVSRIAVLFAEEKEKLLAQGLFMMGLEVSGYLVSYFVLYSLWYLVQSIIIASMFTYVFPNADMGIMLWLFFFYSMAVFWFAFMISNLFSRAKTAAVATALLHLTLYFASFAPADDNEVTYNSLCLVPTICLKQAFTDIATLEQDEPNGMDYGNWTPRIQNALWMLFIDCVLFFALGLYFGTVRSTVYGTQRPFWFVFQPSYWKARCERIGHGNGLANSHVVDESVCKNPGNTDPAFYEVPESAMLPRRSVVIRDVSLIYNRGDSEKEVHAVKHVSLDFFEGEIHGLLGHNGAGKTSLIGVLTGLVNATSGSVFVNGHNARYKMSEIRESLGVCPQHNTLFDDLTVLEHLRMFARLKRVPSDRMQAEIDEQLDSLQLRNEKDVRSKSLSGGFKRKLSIALALLGDTKFVLLDEPTTGIDAFARKQVWDVLKQASKKPGRTILLTTHFMDEADFLSDRITILSHGSVSCSGSSLFLKKAFGVGYTFTLSKDTHVAHMAREEIGEIVTKHVPQASVLSDVAAQTVYRLQFDAAESFPEMFEEIEGKKQALGLESYAVGVTTLEEVFLKVGQLAYKEGNQTEGVAKLNHTALHDDNENDDKEAHKTEQKQILSHKVAADVVEPEYEDATEWSQFFRNFGALFVKRLKIAKADTRSRLYTLLYPPIILACGVALAFAGGKLTYSLVDIRGALSGDDVLITYNTIPGDDRAENFLDAAFGGLEGYELNEHVIDIGQGEHLTDFQQELVNGYYEHGFGNRRLGGFGFYYEDSLEHHPSYSSWNVTFAEPGFYGGDPNPTKPTAAASDLPDFVVVMMNASYRDSGVAYTNLLHNAVLKYATGDDTRSITMNIKPFPQTQEEEADATQGYVFYLGVALMFPAAGAVAFVVQERATKAKHLQLLSGAGLMEYWLANYAWDVTNYMVTLLLLVIVTLAYNVEQLIDHDAFWAFLLAMILFPLSMFPLAYILSFFFHSRASAVNMSFLATFLLGPILYTTDRVIVILAELNDDPDTVDLMWKFRFMFRLLPTYCIQEVVSQIIEHSAEFVDEASPNGLWTRNVTGYALAFLAWTGPVYLLLVLGMEKLGSTPAFLTWMHRKSQGVSPWLNVPEDIDVVAERERVLTPGNDDLVQVHNLRRVFPFGTIGKVAVDNICFGVPAGQVFGFLGSNGAGKTSTIEMLIGNMVPDSGYGLILGHNTSTQQRQIRKKVGYCPQFDALLPAMTGRDMLRLFARFKGVKKSTLEQYVQDLLELLDLSNYADRACGSYSGGNKRKLSVALAFVGNPSVLFLDEISSGVDPQSKRFMWDILSSTMNVQGRQRSVVLVSHSMDEVEALSNNIAIMVAGSLRCFGTAAHLKHRFGRGLHLEFSIAGEHDTLHQFIGTEFNAARPVLLEERGRIVKIQVDKAAFSLADVFRKINAFVNAVDRDVQFSVSETTLERIFINFARADPRLRLGAPDPHTQEGQRSHVGDVKMASHVRVHHDPDDVEMVPMQQQANPVREEEEKNASVVDSVAATERKQSQESQRDSEIHLQQVRVDHPAAAVVQEQEQEEAQEDEEKQESQAY